MKEENEMLLLRGMTVCCLIVALCLMVLLWVNGCSKVTVVVDSTIEDTTKQGVVLENKE